VHIIRNYCDYNTKHAYHIVLVLHGDSISNVCKTALPGRGPNLDKGDTDYKLLITKYFQTKTTNLSSLAAKFMNFERHPQVTTRIETAYHGMILGPIIAPFRV